MAVTVKQMSLTVAFFGVLSFVFGVIAENKKVICNIHSKFLYVCDHVVANFSMFKSLLGEIGVNIVSDKD